MTEIETNGITYSAGDVKINILGRTLVGITKIKYGSKQEKKNLYGMGRQPISRGHGNKTYEGTITLKAWEVDALQQAAADSGGDITDIKPFTVEISYNDDDENQIKTDRLSYVEFTGDVREVKGGESDIEYDLELMVGAMERNV